MSIRLPLNQLSEGERNIILKQLCFEKKANTLFNAPSAQVYPYEIVDEGMMYTLFICQCIGR